jgi:hypothetical protein
MPDGNRAASQSATGFPPVYHPVMVRFGGRTEVTAIDARPFVAALPNLLVQWRSLAFVDGIVRHPVTEKPHDGLRVVDGQHPHPGVAYRLMVREDDLPAPAPEEAVDADVNAPTGEVATTWHTYVIRLDADDSERTCFRVHHDVSDIRAWIELASRGSADVRLEVPDWLGSRGLLSGTVTVRLQVDAARLPPYENGEPQLVVTATHPCVRATADLGVAPAAPGRWTMATRGDAGGVGWMRPVVWLITPFVRGPVLRGVDEFLVVLTGCLDALSRKMAGRYPASPDPDTLAAQMMAELISSVPTTTPDSVRSA